MQRRLVPGAVHQQLPRLLLEHVHERYAQQLPHHVGAVHLEDGVARVPEVGPEERAGVAELGGVEEVRGVAHGEVVRVQQHHLVEPGVEQRVGLDGKAALGILAEGGLAGRHLAQRHARHSHQLVEVRRVPAGELPGEGPHLHGQRAAVVAQQPHHRVRRDHQTVVDGHHDAARRGGGVAVLLCLARFRRRRVAERQRRCRKRGKLRRVRAADDRRERAALPRHHRALHAAQQHAALPVRHVRDLAVPRPAHLGAAVAVARRVPNGRRRPAGAAAAVCAPREANCAGSLQRHGGRRRRPR
mmetsp:Transcript_15042/g.38679  ORF Transcript_15042/g.38679 Transcript_15042/m.38679 type:complete len:300 (+) Transcript_15042:954-1853(+)